MYCPLREIRTILGYRVSSTIKALFQYQLVTIWETLSSKCIITDTYTYSTWKHSEFRRHPGTYADQSQTADKFSSRMLQILKGTGVYQGRCQYGDTQDIMRHYQDWWFPNFQFHVLFKHLAYKHTFFKDFQDPSLKSKKCTFQGFKF